MQTPLAVKMIRMEWDALAGGIIPLDLASSK